MENRDGGGSGSWSGSGFVKIFCAAWMNVFVSGCGEWRRDVCQVSWEEIHDGENETVVENVEEFVVEVVDVVGLRNDGWWIVRAWDLGGLLVEYTGLESFPPLLGYWIPLWTSSEVCHQD